MAVEPEEAQHAADHCPAQHGHLAGLRNARHAQISGPAGVSGGVDQPRHGGRGGNQASAGQPVQAVGKVHRVGGRHDHDTSPAE